MAVSFLVALPITLFNITAALTGNSISVLHIVATALYLVYWMVYGFYTGYKKAKNFLIFNFIFWGLNLGLIIMEYTIELGEFYLLFIIPLYNVLVPMFGLHYFIRNSHIVSPFIGYCLMIIPPLACSISGYLLGLMKYNLKRKKSLV
jgi:hypothetical protein